MELGAIGPIGAEGFVYTTLTKMLPENCNMFRL